MEWGFHLNCGIPALHLTTGSKKMDRQQMAKADFITSILLIFASLFIMIYTLFGFPRFPEWGPLYANPGFTPFFLGLALFLMSIYLLARSLKDQGQQVRTTMEAVKLFFASRRWFVS